MPGARWTPPGSSACSKTLRLQAGSQPGHDRGRHEGCSARRRQGGQGCKWQRRRSSVATIFQSLSVAQHSAPGPGRAHHWRLRTGCKRGAKGSGVSLLASGALLGRDCRSLLCVQPTPATSGLPSRQGMLRRPTYALLKMWADRYSQQRADRRPQAVSGYGQDHVLAEHCRRARRGWAAQRRKMFGC